MAQVRDEGRPARAKKAPVRNRVVVTNTARKAAGAAVDAYVTEVTLSQDCFARIAGRPGPLQKILAGYADSVSVARRAGRGVTLRIHVSPSGDADQIDLGSSGDVLETALAAARERGRATVSEILKNTEMLSAREFGMLIGASHETVNVRRRRHEILGLEGAVRGIRYPRWQLTDDGRPLPGLPRLFALLGDAWTVHRFLLANHPDLAGRTGLEALKAGEIDTALAIATNQVTGVFA